VRSLRHSLAVAAVAALAAMLWAAPAHAATVANPGPVTLTVIPAGGPGDIGGIEFPGFSAAGMVDADGGLLFPAGGIDWPAEVPANCIFPTPCLESPGVYGGLTPFEPTHDATGAIDPATGAASLHLRAQATVTAGMKVAGIDFGIRCPVGSVANPIDLPLSTDPLSPPGPDAPVPYDQATGIARLVGSFTGWAIDAGDCSISGDVAALVCGNLCLVPGAAWLEDLYDDAPVTFAARFVPAPHAPGFTPPSPPGTPMPPAPAAPSTSNLVQAPSNLFTVGAAALSSSKGSATLTLDLPGPGTVKALATANLPAGAAKKITVSKATRRATRAGKLKLTLKPSKAALRHLRRRGKLRTSVKLTYTPTGGSARIATRKLTLKLKRKPR